MTPAGATHGSFTLADRDDAFPGVRRVAFSSLHSTVTGYAFDPGVEHGLQAGVQGARIVAVVTPKRGAPDEFTVSA